MLHRDDVAVRADLWVGGDLRGVLHRRPLSVEPLERFAPVLEGMGGDRGPQHLDGGRCMFGE